MAAITEGNLVSAARWELLEAQRLRVAASIRGVCLTEADVEDCVQEAILRVAQFDDIDATGIHRLLRKVAFNLAMDLHRNRRRHARALARHGVAHSDGPEALALDSLEASRLAAHARALSFRERAALNGRAYGFAPSETATLLGDSPKSVHLALSRARTTLRRLAEAGLLVLLWLKRRATASLRASAPMLPPLVAGLALLFQSHAYSSPSTPAHVAQARVALDDTPYNGHSVGSPRHARLPSSITNTKRVVSPVDSHSETVVMHSTIGDRRTLQATASITQGNPNEPVLTAVVNCLQPAAISLDPHDAGCKG